MRCTHMGCGFYLWLISLPCSVAWFTKSDEFNKFQLQPTMAVDLFTVPTTLGTMMPTPQTPPSPTSNPPVDPHPIVLQPAYPYFTQKQITALSSRLRSPLWSESKEVLCRLQACYWIEEVGNYLQWYSHICQPKLIMTALSGQLEQQ